MQTDLSRQSAQSPAAAILNAPGSWRRIAAVALSVLAMPLPVISGTTFGLPTSYYLPTAVPWTLLFPVVAAVSLLTPAIRVAVPWLRLLDIASALLGVIVSIFLVADLMQANEGLNALAGTTGRSAPRGMATNLGPGIGAYALFAATVAAVLAALARQPRPAP